jgi:hypothetical protein
MNIKIKNNLKILFLTIILSSLFFACLKVTTSPSPGAGTQDFFETTTLPLIVFPIWMIISGVSIYYFIFKEVGIKKWKSILVSIGAYIASLVLIMIILYIVYKIFVNDTAYPDFRFTFSLQKYLFLRNPDTTLDFTDFSIAITYYISISSIIILLNFLINKFKKVKS